MRTEKQVSILGVVTLFILVLTGCSETQKQTSAEKSSKRPGGKSCPWHKHKKLRRSLRVS